MHCTIQTIFNFARPNRGRLHDPRHDVIGGHQRRDFSPQRRDISPQRRDLSPPQYTERTTETRREYYDDRSRSPSPRRMHRLAFLYTHTHNAKMQHLSFFGFTTQFRYRQSDWIEIKLSLPQLLLFQIQLKTHKKG